MSNREDGKGSTPRPFSVAQAEYEARWDAIFGRESNDKVRDFQFDKSEEYSSELTSEMNNSDNFKQQPKETKDE
jgi:hypothetical protein